MMKEINYKDILTHWAALIFYGVFSFVILLPYFWYLDDFYDTIERANYSRWGESDPTPFFYYFMDTFCVVMILASVIGGIILIGVGFHKRYKWVDKIS